MIFDIFSKRQIPRPDVFTYDKIPDNLRVQVVQILQDTLGDKTSYNDGWSIGEGIRNTYKFIVETLRREYGLFSLTKDFDEYTNRYDAELYKFLLHEKDAAMVLDAIELSCRVIDKCTRTWDYRHNDRASSEADEAIDELNARFREHGVGYQFLDGEIIRTDSELLHAEVVKPALTLLSGAMYSGAQEEFLKAHEHYRHGRKEEALNECLKALESVMKIICAKRGWSHDSRATSKDLLKLLFDNDLIPSFWNSHFSALRSTLEAGVPTARNKLAGHGQGTQVREVPDYVVSYVLHQTAAAIVFLVEAEKA